MAGKEKKTDDDKRPIVIIKRVKKMEGGHHGGSWKVAYADFVTAMMAFFLLLWLLAVTTDVQKKKIAEYFSPTKRVSEELSGAGGLLAGTSVSDQTGAMLESGPPQGDASDNPLYRKEMEQMDREDEKAFRSTEEAIRQAVESVPELHELAKNLMIDMTPEGLRIQIVDQAGQPMFASGSAAPLPAATKLLALISGSIKELPNQISVRGHTDSASYGKDAAYTNWELSTDRANASRRALLANGLNLSRFEDVQGRADREPLVTEDPANPRNRRVSILLLKQSVMMQSQRNQSTLRKPAGPVTPARPAPKRREEGVIYFP